MEAWLWSAAAAVRFEKASRDGRLLFQKMFNIYAAVFWSRPRKCISPARLTQQYWLQQTAKYIKPNSSKEYLGLGRKSIAGNLDCKVDKPSTFEKLSIPHFIVRKGIRWLFFGQIDESMDDRRRGSNSLRISCWCPKVVKFIIK
jgi:hypothetical protein